MRGLPSRETWTHLPLLLDLAVRRANRHLLAIGSGPHPDRGLGIGGRVGLAIPGQARDRHVDGDRVDVQALEIVDAGRGLAGDQVERVERAQPAEVEDRAEVDEERIVALAGEGPAAALERGHRAVGHGRVVRIGARADIGRGHGDRRADVLAVVALGPGDAVDLTDILVRVADRGDLTGVVEVGSAVLDDRPESEPVRHVLLAVPVVVDVDGVADVRVEGPEVRAAGRILHRDVVGDEVDP